MYPIRWENIMLRFICMGIVALQGVRCLKWKIQIKNYAHIELSLSAYDINV